jgi:hypothetical protein
LPLEAKSVYDLLHGEIEDLFDQKLSIFADTLTKSINAKFDTATSTYTGQLNELHDELSLGTFRLPTSAVLRGDARRQLPTASES